MELTEPYSPLLRINGRKKNNQQGTDMLKQALKIYDQRMMLQEKIDAATAQVQEWKRVRSRVKETTQQIQRWEKMKCAIDDGIRNFQQFSATIPSLTE